MTTGISSLRKVQIGKESTKGTAVAATAALRGLLKMNEAPSIHIANEERATLADVKRTVKTGNLVNLSYEEDATFEEILYFLMMGVLGNLNPTSANPTGVKHDDNSVFADLTNAFDGNSATSETIVGFVAADDKLYIRSASKFRAIRVDIGSTPNALASTISTIECSDGSTGWLECTLVRDRTLDSSGTKSMAVDGTIEFTPHADWESDTVDSDDGYWIRITWDGNWTASTIINDIYTVPLACVWTFTPNLAAAGTFDSFTLEHGDNIQAHEVEYCMASRIEISFSMNDVAMLRVDMFGRKKTACTFTAALTAPTVESILGQKFKLYIDAETGTIGSTEVTATLLGATFTINTGLKPIRKGDGSLDFSIYAEDVKSVDLRLTLAYNSTIETERTYFDGETLRLIRLENTGSLISGTDYNKLTLDFCGYYTDFPDLDSKDGEDIVNVSLHSQLGSNYTKLFEVAVTNEWATLP